MTPPLPALLLTVSAVACLIAILWFGEPREGKGTRTMTEKEIGQMDEKEVPGKLEFFEGRLREVKDASRSGWWRFNQHYDRDGYCDNPARGY